MNHDMLYLVKKNDIDMDYTFLCRNVSLKTLNRRLKEENIPTVINNNDHTLLTNFGGTCVRYDDGYFYWIINIKASVLEKCLDPVFDKSPLIDNINDIIKRLKRDININNILSEEV